VIDGIDQSGKKTQTELLVKRVRQEGFRCTRWAFPVYQTTLGKRLNAYLGGKERPDPHVVHLLYAANKWEVAARIDDQLRQGCIVIANRYTPSNLAYGRAHGLPLDWLFMLEAGLPKPNKVIILDVSTDVSYERKKRGRDVHEEDLLFLERVRRSYIRIGKRYCWKIIDGAASSEEVNSRIWKTVTPILRSVKSSR
jgi:dTMP kinase